jgi:hypothetical protein
VARRPEHHPVAAGLAEAGVGRAVVTTDVRLELDDPAASPARRIVADEPGADQRRGGLERGALQDRPVDDAQSNE